MAVRISREILPIISAALPLETQSVPLRTGKPFNSALGKEVENGLHFRQWIRCIFIGVFYLRFALLLCILHDLLAGVASRIQVDFAGQLIELAEEEFFTV